MTRSMSDLAMVFRSGDLSKRLPVITNVLPLMIDARESLWPATSEVTVSASAAAELEEGAVVAVLEAIGELDAEVVSAGLDFDLDFALAFDFLAGLDS